MRLRERRFPRRRGQRLRRTRWRMKRNKSKRKRWGVFRKLVDWWNRRQFYTFHKDEIITHKNTCTSPLRGNNNNSQDDDGDDEVEWNNESESEDPEQYSDTASKYDSTDEKASQAEASSDLAEDEETLKTIEEEAPLDDSLVTIEEEVTSEEESPRLGSKPKVSPPPPPAQQVPPPPPQPSVSTIKAFQHHGGTVDSIANSLESLDSLVSSQWDPEDDASTVTPLVTNIHPTNEAFFVEHVRFLQVQTQPRKVEEVYHSNDSKSRSANE